MEIEDKTMSELAISICLAEFEKLLENNSKWSVVGRVVAVLAYLVLGFFMQFPFLITIAGALVLQTIVLKIFIFKEEKILRTLEEFCEKHNVDLLEE